MADPLIAWFDTETNGLLKEATVMHSLCFILSDGRVFSCADQHGYDGQTEEVILRNGNVVSVTKTSIARGFEVLNTADVQVAHNGQDFDIRVSLKLRPNDCKPKAGYTEIDTLLVSRLLFPEIMRLGPNTHLLPGNMKDSHSVKALGLRIGEPKDTGFDGGDWQTWSEEMQTYCVQDVFCLKKIFNFLMSRKPDPRAVETEHDFARIIRRQEAWGFTFNFKKAEALSIDLQRTERKLEANLIKHFGEWWEPDDVVTIAAARMVKCPQFPNVTLRRYSPLSGKELKPYCGPPLSWYEQGAQYTPIKRVIFAPSSRDHVRKMLVQKHGWKPTVRTKKTKLYPNGQIKVDDDILRALPWQEAQDLADFYVVMKVRGYLSSGANAWLRLAQLEPDGCHRIHGRVNTNRAISGRCGHMKPNLGQVPAIEMIGDEHAEGLAGHYGYECRDLFGSRPGMVLVGHDGSGLEYCLLAHYAAKWDGGLFADIVTNSKPHAWFRDEVVGTDILGEGLEGYNKMKTLGYAYIYGAGEAKLGAIVQPTWTEAKRRTLGKEIKRRMLTKFEPLAKLDTAIKDTLSNNGFLIGLDGRKLFPRKAHGALNILLQAGGAIAMKRSLILLDNRLQAEGLKCGIDGTGREVPDPDYEYCANVHDEVQSDVHPRALAAYSKAALWSVPEAGVYLRLKCPLRAELKTGSSWATTH